MPWIESHTVLLRHRKLLELARELRLRPSHALGHLHALWHAALEQQEDGDLSSWTDEFIADSSDYPGDAPKYVRLLQKHGWIDGRLLHDWLDYAGAFLTGKYHTSKRGRLSDIWRKHGREYGKREAVSEKSLESHSTLPNQPNRTLPTYQPESFRQRPIAAFLPEGWMETADGLKRVKLKNPESLFPVWKQAYPDVDLLEEIKKCDAWGESNAVTRSPKGWARTLNTWLKREQDRRKGGYDNERHNGGRFDQKLPGAFRGDASSDRRDAFAAITQKVDVLQDVLTEHRDAGKRG